MSSIYLVRRGAEWMYQLHGIYDRFGGSIDCADMFTCRHIAETAAKGSGGEVVEFREVAGDTAAGALAAAEATIARLRDELEQLRNRPSTHELAKRYLEATE